MKILEGINRILRILVENIHKRRKAILALSCIVVFVTTYVLILPAFTLEKEKAEEQGGIDLPVSEVSTEVGDEDLDVDDPKQEDEVKAKDIDNTETDDSDVTQDENEYVDVSGSSESDVVADNEVSDPLRYENDNYNIAVVDKDNVLPENTEIKVGEINKEEKANEYKKYFKDALTAVQDEKGGEKVTTLKFAHFYDISLVADGREIEPTEGEVVDVRIEYSEEFRKALNVKDTDNLKIVHFAVDKETGETATEVLDDKKVEVNTDKKDKLEDATFEAESFSVYAVVYTVDFSYSVDGETYEYSIDGESSVSLRALLQTLNVISDDDDTDVSEIDLFMNEIDTVEFTDRELISIEKADTAEDEAADWTLTSLKPFDTEEKLTITMKNGDVFEVAVTDERIEDRTELVDDTFYIIYIESNGQYYALRADGESQLVPNRDLDSLGRNFYWNCHVYNGTQSGDYTTWTSSTGSHLYLNQNGNNVIYDQYPTWVYLDPDNHGFYFTSYSNNNPYRLDWDSTNGFKVSSSGHKIYVYKPVAETFGYTVKTNKPALGTVSGNGQSNVISYTTVTATNKTNTTDIVATPIGDATFTYWLLNGVELQGYGPTIPAGSLTFTDDNSELMAVFHKEYTSDATQRINEWVDSLLEDSLTADKTAHVYDYDNRIYQIDFSASSGRYTIDSDAKIELITDTSRSMYFPENLIEPQNYYINGQINLGEWLLRYGDTSKTYFTIGDQNGTATMYAVYATGNQYYTQWNMVDASYYQAPDGATRNPTRVAYVQPSSGRRDVYITNQFAANRPLTGTLYQSTQKVDGKDWNRLDYLTSAVKAVSRAIYALDPGAEIGLVTFNSAAAGGILYDQDHSDHLFDALDNISTSGGTNPTSAFNLINREGFFNEPGTKKQVAILITDGAPQGTTWDAIQRAADTMKGYHSDTETYDVDLYTLGLSLEHVGNNKDLLFGLSTGYAGNAENDDELVTEVEKLLNTLLVKASFCGDITDTIDPAFYPVDSTGQPIIAGYYDKNGQRINQPPSNVVPYSEWVNNNGVWTVTWHNQEIKWPEEGGWHKSIYVKAKEDFMGGNRIDTNIGDSNKVETSYIYHSGSSNGVYPMENTFTKTFASPLVNIDELTLNENSTEWRVHLGTEVDPKTELEELWKMITVNQVVNDNGVEDDHVIVINSNTDMYYSIDTSDSDKNAPDGEANETLPLTNYVELSVLQGLLSQIEDGNTSTSAMTSVPYSAYGHNSVGYFTIELSKEVNADAAEDNAPQTHETKEKGENKEIYTITVTYTPSGSNASETYEKTTPGKTGGKIADGYDGTSGTLIQSENVHKIHVFAKSLHITKTDIVSDSILTGAEFKLYRTAREGETEGLITIGGNSYYPVASLDTSEDGKALTEIKTLHSGESYYLVETVTPPGYQTVDPIPVILTINDIFVPKPGIIEQSSRPDAGIYDWTQTATLIVTGSNIKRTNADRTEDLTNTGMVADSSNATVYYDIANTSGVELPYTGGIGTTIFYVLGSLLVITSSVYMISRRRIRRYNR